MTAQINKILPKLETVFLAAAIFSYLGKILDFRIPYLLLISITGLAFVFFLNAFKVEQPQTEVKNASQKFTILIAPKILWISLSIVAIGILFYLMNLNTDSLLTMLLIGGSSIVLTGVVTLIIAAINSTNINDLLPIFYRAVPALLITTYIVYNSMSHDRVLQLHSLL